jgi:hypothetical protein
MTAPAALEEGAAAEIVADRGRNHHQEAGGGRQRGREPAGDDETDHPVRQLGNLRIGEHVDIVVDGDFVGQTVRGGGAADLHPAVAILVVEGDEAGGFPIGEPGRARRFAGRGEGGAGIGMACRRDIGGFVDRVDDVEPGKGADGGSDCVEDGDEDKRPAGGQARVGGARNGEEADDDVRQARSAEHQRSGDAEDVEG